MVESVPEISTPAGIMSHYGSTQRGSADTGRSSGRWVRRTLGLLCLTAACSLVTPLWCAEPVEFDGLCLRLSDDWQVDGVGSEARSASSWQWTADGDATLHVVELERAALVAANVRRDVISWFETRLAASPGVERCEVLAAHATRVDGQPAWRVRARLELDGDLVVDQLLYVVVSNNSWVLTFSARPEEYAELEAAFEEVLDTAIVQHSLQLGATAPVLGVALLVGLARLLRSRSRRRGRVDAA